MMKSFLVTGGNKGIGLAIVRRILVEIPNSFVYLGSRDQARGQTAAKLLASERSDFSSRLKVVELDVSNDESVCSAKDIVERDLNNNIDRQPLFAIVNNAGVSNLSPGVSISDVININLYGPRRVVESFLPMLNRKGRIVMISSAAGPMHVASCSDSLKQFYTKEALTWEQIKTMADKVIEFSNSKDDTELKKLGFLKFDEMTFYGFSKALLNCYTCSLAKDRRVKDMKVNACTPGMIDTDLVAPMIKNTGKTAKEFGAKSPHEGASSCMFLLTSEDCKGNGWYYGSDSKRSPIDRYRAPGDPEFIPNKDT